MMHLKSTGSEISQVNMRKKIPRCFASIVQVGGPRPVHSGTRALKNESARGMYGLISIIGDPWRASSPLTDRVHPSTFNRSAMHRPNGFGREGLRQAKTPVSTSTLCLFGKTNKVCLSFSLSRRCIQYRMIMWEKAFTPLRPAQNFG